MSHCIGNPNVRGDKLRPIQTLEQSQRNKFLRFELVLESYTDKVGDWVCSYARFRVHLLGRKKNSKDTYSSSQWPDSGTGARLCAPVGFTGWFQCCLLSLNRIFPLLPHLVWSTSSLPSDNEVYSTPPLGVMHCLHFSDILGQWLIIMRYVRRILKSLINLKKKKPSAWHWGKFWKIKETE